MKKNIFIFCILFFLFYAHVSAQNNTGNALIITTPLSPGANEDVTTELRAFSFDVNSSFITWTRNGSVSLSGTGAKTFHFRSGAIGKKEVIEASIRTIDAKTFSVKKEFLIGDIDLLWKADTITPPEYKGKALASPFSSITVSALPHFSSGGFTSSSNELEFEWSLDGRRDAGASGIGKNVFQFKAAASPTGYQVALKTKNAEKNISFEKSISIQVVSPEVFIYENRPLEGPIIGNALSQITLQKKENKTFHAVPYFFPKEDLSSLSYEWTQNGEDKKTSPANLFQLNLEDIGRSTITLEILIKNTKRIIQKAESKLTINVQ